MKYILIVPFITLLVQLRGQNTIVKKDGERIACKVIEVSPELIKFTKSQITNSPIFSMSLIDIDTVYYQEDYFEVYNTDLPKTEKPVKKVGPKILIDPRDSSTYPIVQIGEQYWFAKNLAFDTTGSTVYENDTSYLSKFGRLYSYETALNACPCGWHLPSDNEWKTLEIELGMLRGVHDAGWRGTSPGQGDLLKPGTTTGFDAEFGGAKLKSEYWFIKSSAFFWTSTEREWNPKGAWIRQLNERASINRDHQPKSSLLSVRCIMD